MTARANVNHCRPTPRAAKWMKLFHSNTKIKAANSVSGIVFKGMATGSGSHKPIRSDEPRSEDRARQRVMQTVLRFFFKRSQFYDIASECA